MSDPGSGCDWSTTRVAVLGGGGFLGSHVVAQLRRHGAEPIVPRTRDGWDFTELPSAARFFADARPEIVFNCAARQGGLEYQRRYPADVYFDNMRMGLNTLHAAAHGGVRKYINIVAACSYPGDGDGAMAESDYWSGPLHPTVVNYGFTKKAQVVQGECYRRQFGFDSIHLLMTNLYGPGEHFHPDRSHGLAALLLKFYEARRFGLDEVVLWGSGRAVREWLFAADAAEAVVAAAEGYSDAAPLNVSVGEGLSIAALADIIRELVGYTGVIAYDPERPDGAACKTFDNAQIRHHLGWRPRTPLRMGIARTLEWLDRHYPEAAQAR